jgi:hypothetical protein
MAIRQYGIQSILLNVGILKKETTNKGLALWGLWKIFNFGNIWHIKKKCTY